MSFDPRFVVFILFATAVSYCAGIMLSKSRSDSSSKRIAVISSVLCLLPLVFFKYAILIVQVFLDISGSNSSMPLYLQGLILPIGISFFTFQAVSYIIDVYRNKLTAERHFGYYALYISFFPQLVAGPIERAGNILPQFRNRHFINEDDCTLGLRKILLGLFKKVVIADSLSIFVNSVYNNLTGRPGITLIIATVFFGIQIYCDFSGYSDIAIGSARLYGITLMENFKTPYGAKSLQDFWRRWHISLSTWFTDYVYIPLGGSREGALKLMRNLIVTFALSGLWHGADYTFIIWGVYLGVLMSAERLLSGMINYIFGKLRKVNELLSNITRIILTWLFVMTGWIFFRSNNISDLRYILNHLYKGLNPLNIGIYLNAIDISGPFFALCVLLALSVLIFSAMSGCNVFSKLDIDNLNSPTRYSIYWLIGFAIILAVFLRPVGVAADFIYFQF